jgi:D-lactate dehydrogenase
MGNSEFQVFFYEAFEEERAALEKYNDGSIAAGYDWKTIQEAGHAAPPAPIISIRTQSQIPSEWGNQLQGILTRSTGYDHLTAYCRENQADDIAMGYLPLYCNRAVAEQAMLFWTALLRRLPLQQQQFAAFHRDGITGGECAGRILAVFGVGNIGYQVVRIGRGLDMQVVGVDIDPKYRDIYYVSPETALEQADVIVCTMNLTSNNRDYFDYECLKQAKPGAAFVNVARGELSPPEDLLRLLEEKHLGGVGLDVYPDEKMLGPALRGELPGQGMNFDAINALQQRHDVILTPHNAFNTEEAVELKSEQSIQQLHALINDHSFIWGLS